MSSTVACFCGNVYTAPPDRCEVCGRSSEPAAGDGPVIRRERKTLDRWLTGTTVINVIDGVIVEEAPRRCSAARAPTEIW